MRRLLVITLFASSAAGSLALAAPLQAAAADVVTASAGTAALEEVVVTAQRREQNIQRVGAAVSVVCGAALQQRAINNIEQLSTSVPNLQWGNMAGSSLITVRGVGTAV